MSQPHSSQDCLESDLELASFQDLVEGVSWRILDVQKSSDNIRRTAYAYQDNYANRNQLKCAAADLRDILLKLESIEQYMNQQQ